LLIFVLPTLILTEPELPETASPVNRRKSPLEPPTASPVPIITRPELPDPVVPLLSNSMPLVPADTAFALRMYTAPLEDEPPAPLTTLTTPPTRAVAVVSPAFTYTSPPWEESVEPTNKLMLPALPPFD
jgi:hypothetical protein